MYTFHLTRGTIFSFVTGTTLFPMIGYCYSSICSFPAEKYTSYQGKFLQSKTVQILFCLIITRRSTSSLTSTKLLKQICYIHIMIDISCNHYHWCILKYLYTSNTYSDHEFLKMLLLYVLL